VPFPCLLFPALKCLHFIHTVIGGGAACLPCNGKIACASSAAVRVQLCSDSPKTEISAGDEGQWFDPVTLSDHRTPHTSSITLRSTLSPSLCLAADGQSSVVKLPCNTTSPCPRWINHSNSALSPESAAASSHCLDWGSTITEPPATADCLVVRGVRLCAACLVHEKTAKATPSFCDPSHGTANRISDLISRLTLEEKAALMSSGPHAVNGVPRLGVPPLPTGEGLHGLVADCQGETCATSFPHLTAVGATFNRSLFRSLGNVVGSEARGMKAQLNVWGPDINLARDPRWGRAQEVASEDPTLTAAFALGYVAGMQDGVGDEDRYLQVVSSPKHAWGA
jgi:hypothetical protein